ncbi:hypothetical protein [uncultured Roseobacter sp.]|uniref:hypothetical protein n=1 Tax=uncultured Roseobacter sp. TaxID=114847 RepID=UPI00262F5EF7|nr:hypothetical protein [uncultured Roseobacter sp.]
MIKNNKILTVSYGTFSCTLEGFDDSFDTMKAIAEYFRDLAADDRYFGAEPPQPDAEMLAQIAQRELARRVQASEQDGRITLTAAQENTEAAAEAAVVVTAAPAVQEAAHPVAPELPVAEPAPLATAPAETYQEIQPADPVVAPLVQDAPETFQHGTDPADTAAPVDAPAAAEAFFAQSPDIDESFEIVEDNAPLDVPAADIPLAEPLEVAEVSDTARNESIADRLARIRAVVSRHDDEDVVVDEDYEEDIRSEAPLNDSFPTIAMPDFQPVREEFEDEDDNIAAQTDGDVIAGFVGQADADLSDPDIVKEDQLTGEALAEITAWSVQQEDPVEEADVHESLQEDDLSAILDRIDSDMTAEAAADLPEQQHRETPGSETVSSDAQTLILTQDDTVSPDRDTAPKADPSTADNLFAGESADDAASLMEDGDVIVTGRVLKVNTEELNAALESGELEILDDAEATATTEPASRTSARDTLPAIGDGADEDVSRLMAEADHQMEEPEGATRRSAFSHLRAAVAARFADKSMDTDAEDKASVEKYRSDLAEVVKPRRPASEPAARTDRPAPAQPMPLKLVAAQRIDDSSEPVAPRRVAATFEAGDDLAPDTGFAAFAEEMGATRLPDLLEAAAAYMAFVEGQEQFSRPQLMTRVRQAGGGNFSREDGLRSFGQLLRAGKIEKMQGGRFAASQEIGYRPDERAAG